MSKGKAPAAPDYIGAAKEQGKQNLDAIRLGAAMNRVNQTTPYGSTTYKDLGNDQYEQVTSLSPDQQALLDQNEANQLDLGKIAQGRLSQVGAQGALDLSGLPSRVTSTPTSQYRTDIDTPATRYSDLDLSGLSSFGNAPVQASLDYSGAPARADANYQTQLGPNYQTQLGPTYQKTVDFSGAPNLPGQNDFGAERQRVEDALYQRSTADLDPQFQQREQALRTQLLNSGNTEGSEAWNTAMANLERERQAAYGDARDRAIAAGGAEQSRLFGDALTARQQATNEDLNLGNFANTAALNSGNFANTAALNSGNFANSAADAENQYGLAARAQGLGEVQSAGQFSNSAASQINQTAASQRAQQLAEALQRGQFGNEAAQQEFQSDLARTGIYNDAQNNAFSQAQANAQLQNQGRDAGLQEQITQRELPLQEFMSLYGGAPAPQVSAPNVPQAGTPQPGDYQGAVDAQYGAQSDLYNWQQQRNAQNMNAAMQLAMMYFMGSGS